jgi:hypothetical protein
MRLLLLVCLVACEQAGPTTTIALAPPAPSEPISLAARSTVPDTVPAPPVPLDPPQRPAAAPIQVGRDLVGMRVSVKQWFVALSPQDRHVVRAACRARASTPCWQLREMRVDGEQDVARNDPFTPRQFAEDTHLDEFCQRTTGNGRCNTPLVISFDDAPVTYLPATHRFTFQREPLTTDWPTAATPWIAIDRDGDGAITSGFELFGDATAKNGFLALAALDANADGVIDRADPDFAKLLLWADANGDRESTPDELRPLASVVVAIPLANRLDPRCTNGDCEGERGTVQLLGGRTGAVIDIYLAER